MLSERETDAGSNIAQTGRTAAADGTPASIYAISLATAAAAISLDYTFAMGFGGGVPYLFFALTGWWYKEKKALFLLAAAASVLTVLGFFVSPEGSIGWSVLNNRAYSVITIWVMAAVLYQMHRHFERDRRPSAAARNQSPYEGRVVAWEIMIAAAMTVVILTASWAVVMHIKELVQRDIHAALRSVLATTHSSLREQFESQKTRVRNWSDNQELVSHVLELAKQADDVDFIVGSSSLSSLRVLLKQVAFNVGTSGFSVIGRDNTVIAASRNRDIAAPTPMAKQTGFLERIWQGETLISMPQFSDTPSTDTKGEPTAGEYIIFVATPVRDSAGKIAAILAFHLDPDKVFSPIFEYGYFGESGETYAFNKNAVLISESRFTEQLQQIGLLGDTHSKLHVQLRDPATNMTMGGIPSLDRHRQPLTLMAQKSIAGESGFNLEGYNDYRGVPVVGAWLWDEELGFGMATESDVEEAFVSFEHMRFIILAFTALIIFILALFAFASTKAKRKIAATFKQHQLILNSVGEGIYGVDGQGKATFVNPAACRILGYSADEIIGSSIEHLTNHHLSEDAISPRKTHLPGAAVQHVRSQFDGVTFLRCKDGTQIPVDYSMTPIQRNGEIDGAVVTFSDATTRKTAEETLKRSRDELEQKVAERTARLAESRREAEAATQAKSEFLASMSHEIRTPMNGVVGMIDVLAHSKLAEDDQRMVATIRRSANSLLGIINDILDFSKIEAGKLNLSVEPVNLEDEVEQVYMMLQHIALEKDVNLTLVADPTIPVIVETDKIRLQQILTNLVTNAIKFSAGLGRVGTVSVKVEAEQREANRIWVNFTIADNGIGMNKETQTRLFQAFEQADNSTTRRYGGTGLGLVITRSLVEMMEGEILLQSEPGVGTAITARLPMTLPDTQPSTRSPIAGFNCVVVDAEQKQGADYATYLSKAGAVVRQVMSIEEGYAKYAGDASSSKPFCFVVIAEASDGVLQAKAKDLSDGRANENIRLVLASEVDIDQNPQCLPNQLEGNIIQVARKVLTRRCLLEGMAMTLKPPTSAKDSEKPDEATAPNRVPTRDEAIARGQLILAVEDNAVNREVVRRQLRVLGLAVDMTPNGVDALEEWRSGEYALVLTDLHMPEMDGYELATAIRADEKANGKRPTPIIALTANALKDEEERCLALGMNGYLSKPIEIVRLKEKLTEWLPAAPLPEIEEATG